MLSPMLAGPPKMAPPAARIYVCRYNDDGHHFFRKNGVAIDPAGLLVSLA